MNKGLMTNEVVLVGIHSIPYQEDQYRGYSHFRALVQLLIPSYLGIIVRYR